MEKAKKTIVLAEEIVMNKIYYIRMHKVMLDRDLAELYGEKAIRLREEVKRNVSRFPEVFTEHGVLMLANVLKSERAIEVSLRLIDFCKDFEKCYRRIKTFY
jgi:ORF6N domain